VALGRTEQVRRRVDRVAQSWFDVWRDGYDDVMDESKRIVSSGAFSLTDWIGLASSFTAKTIGASFETWTTMMGCEIDPHQTISLKLEKFASTTDPVPFECPKGTQTVVPTGAFNGPGGASVAVANFSASHVETANDAEIFVCKLSNVPQNQATGSYTGTVACMRGAAVLGQPINVAIECK
jgi:hypothetical protein